MIKFLSIATLLLLASVAYSANLAEELRLKAEESAQKLPPERQKIMQDAIGQLKKNRILENTLKKGAALPPFSLKNASGQNVSSQELLKQGPIVVTFYRGGWCPYCNLQLRAFQNELPKFKAAGAQLIAISPETPDETLSTTQKNDLKFHVLSDPGNTYAKELKLVYQLPNELKGVYKDFGIDLERANGNKNWELPLAATYVVNKKGQIIYAWAAEDYKLRAPMNEVLEALKQ